jgi:hypothetical protein
MAAMTLTPEFVSAASNAWVWVPDNAIVEDEQYKLLLSVRWPGEWAEVVRADGSRHPW